MMKCENDYLHTAMAFFDKLAPGDAYMSLWSGSAREALMGKLTIVHICLDKINDLCYIVFGRI